MKILFVANRFPYPPFRGDKLKIYNLCKRLSKNHDLVLLSFYEDKAELEYLEHIEPFFSHIELVYLPKWRSYLNVILALFSKQPLQLAYFKSRKMHAALQRLLSSFNIDVIHTQHLRMSQYTSELDHAKILDLPDAFSLYWKRRRDTDRAWYMKILDNLEITRLIKSEGVIKKYDLCLVCSQEDKIYLDKVHKSENVRISLNGVDLSTFDVGNGHEYNSADSLLFTGNMDYAPNVDAVCYFVEQLWPEIKSKHKDLKFVIAGQRPIPRVKQLASEDIEVTGFVPSLTEMYKSATVVIAPLRFGAGTQNKVLEAMAMGVPVVCTRIGFEGLEIEDGEGVYLAKNDEEFKNRVSQLLTDAGLREQVGQRGLSVAQSKFSWDIIARNLEAYMNSVWRS
ncbi:MAG: glycosyltransferase [Bacteroidia bacterium]